MNAPPPHSPPPSPYPSACPHCHLDAPVVYRGIVATCTGCERPRNPLTSSSLALSGGPSKLGGFALGAAGIWVSSIGSFFGLLVALLFWWLLSSLVAFFLVFAMALLISLGFGIALFRGGQRLRKSGGSTEVFAQRKAIFALAQNRDAALTAIDVANALQVTPDEADRMLTDLAKEEPDLVTLELDANGSLYFRFPTLDRRGAEPKMRVDDAAWEGEDEGEGGEENRPKKGAANSP